MVKTPQEKAVRRAVPKMVKRNRPKQDRKKQGSKKGTEVTRLMMQAVGNRRQESLEILIGMRVEPHKGV